MLLMSGVSALDTIKRREVAISLASTGLYDTSFSFRGSDSSMAYSRSRVETLIIVNPYTFSPGAEESA